MQFSLGDVLFFLAFGFAVGVIYGDYFAPTHREE
jgi:hypothetical protein